MRFDHKFLGWHYTTDTVSLHNPSKKCTYAFKISTDNRFMFDISNPTGVLDPGQHDRFSVSLSCQKDAQRAIRQIHFRPGVLIPTRIQPHFCTISYVELLQCEDVREKHVPHEKIVVQAAADGFLRSSPEGVKHLPMIFPDKVCPPQFIKPRREILDIEDIEAPKEIIAQYGRAQTDRIADKLDKEKMMKQFRKEYNQ